MDWTVLERTLGIPENVSEGEIQLWLPWLVLKLPRGRVRESGRWAGNHMLLTEEGNSEAEGLQRVTLLPRNTFPEEPQNGDQLKSAISGFWEARLRNL